MPESTMSNKMLSKIFSAEMLIWLIISGITITMGYQALASEQVTAKEERVNTNVQIKDVKTQQREIKTDISLIQKDMAVMANEQRHTNSAMQSNTTDIKQILRILMRHDNRRVLDEPRSVP